MKTIKEAQEAGVVLLPTYISELRKIDQLKSCLKCGEASGYSYNLKRRYCDGLQLADGTECEYSVEDSNHNVVEHLHVTCEKCGHPQLAACHDYDAATVQAGSAVEVKVDEEEGAQVMPWDVLHVQGAIE